MSLVPCDNRRILVVDDETVIRRLFEMVLSWELPDKAIELASNGAEAVDAFAARHHAVLLMDLHMPVMDGHSAFQAIAAKCRDSAWAMPHVVFCTGYAPPRGVREIVARDAGHCLLSKPVSNEELVGAIRERLNQGIRAA